MSTTRLFSKDRTVYWPAEFSDVMDQLTGADPDGRPSGRPALYTYNTGALTLAAAIGVINQRKRDLKSERKEISTSIFANHELEAYIFLIPMLGDKEPNIEHLRPENEEAVIKTFERYAAGGLEILRGATLAEPTQSIDQVVEQLITPKRRSEKVTSGIPLLIDVK